MVTKFSKALFFSLVILASSLQAGINPKNGNFYINYTDIVVVGAGKPLEITRTYNSQASGVGWYGYGWGTPYETYLVVSADGSVVIHENGLGAQTRFTPEVSVDTKAAAKRILDAMNVANAKKGQAQLAGKEYETYAQKLMTDETLRRNLALTYGVEAKLATGTILYSSKRGHQKIVVMPEGYRREYSDGRREEFSLKGKLVSLSEKDGYRIDLSYNKEGTVSSIKDSFAKQIFLEFDSAGHIKSAWSSADKKAKYEYKGDDLLSSIDIAGNEYKYKSNALHAITEVAYTSDKSKMNIEYDTKGWVKSLRERNGEFTQYAYEADPKNPTKDYSTKITRKTNTGKSIVDSFRYIVRNKEDGEPYTYRSVITQDNVTTDTTYSACCSLPEKIIRGNVVSDFKYTKDGLLESKFTYVAGKMVEFVQIAYNQGKKISEVKNNQGVTKFEYDAKFNLVKAENDKGQKVVLAYNKDGKISAIKDNVFSRTPASAGPAVAQVRQLDFKYSPVGKPYEINISKGKDATQVKAIGKINVAYNNAGEITSVDSTANEAMANEVNDAFRNLLSIVKPAGVSLSI